MCASVGVWTCVFCVCVCVGPKKWPYQLEMSEGEGFYLLCFKTWWSARQMIAGASEEAPDLCVWVFGVYVSGRILDCAGLPIAGAYAVGEG